MMGPDYDKYRPLLDDFNLADEQKDEFIDVMWALLDSFVARAHGTDAVQRVLEERQKVSGSSDSDEVKSGKKTPKPEISYE
ncbi:MAG: hypothetical protein AAFQ13_03225 [Pseudomonadota bacterium]